LFSHNPSAYFIGHFLRKFISPQWAVIVYTPDGLILSYLYEFFKGVNKILLFFGKKIELSEKRLEIYIVQFYNME